MHTRRFSLEVRQVEHVVEDAGGRIRLRHRLQEAFLALGLDRLGEHPALFHFEEHAGKPLHRACTPVELLRGPRRTRVRVRFAIAADVEGADGVLVHGDVVRVAVAARRVPREDEVRLHVAHHREDLLDHGFRRLGVEAGGVVVLRRTGHAAVAIGQEAHVRQPDLGHRRAQFEFANVAKRFGRAHPWVADFADFATGAAQEGDRMPGLDECREGAGDLSLVVRVAIDGQDALLFHASNRTAFGGGRTIRGLRLRRDVIREPPNQWKAAIEGPQQALIRSPERAVQELGEREVVRVIARGEVERRGDGEGAAVHESMARFRYGLQFDRIGKEPFERGLRVIEKHSLAAHSLADHVGELDRKKVRPDNEFVTVYMVLQKGKS